MRFFCVVLSVVSLVSLLPHAAVAQRGSEGKESSSDEKKPGQEWTREKIENPPERKLEFVHQQNSIPDFSTQVNFLELRKQYPYVALIDIKEPAAGWGWLSDGKDRELTLLQVLGGKFLMEPALHSHERESTQKAIARFLKHIPEEQQPDEEMLKFLTSDEVNRAIMLDDFDKATKFRRISVFAATEEEARSRAEAVLHVLDWGMFRSLQLKFFNDLEALLEEQKQHQAVVETTAQATEVLRKELADYEEYDTETMTGLKLRQMELDVETVGLKARVEAIARAVKEARNTDVDLARRLEETRVNAEIDLTSLEARRAKTEEFIGKVKKKIDLKKELGAAQSNQAQAAARLQHNLGKISQLEQRLARFQSPELVDDQVVILDLRGK